MRNKNFENKEKNFIMFIFFFILLYEIISEEMFFIYHILTYLHMDTIYIVKELTIARNTRIQMQEYKNNYKQYIITKIIIDTLFRVWCITICMNAKY